MCQVQDAGGQNTEQNTKSLLSQNLQCSWEKTFSDSGDATHRVLSWVVLE